MAGKHVYHWKHGWIPLDHSAALKKAKGNKALAARYEADAHSDGTGIRSRQNLAHAVLDLPNVDSADRPAVHAELKDAAGRLNSSDILPGSLRRGEKKPEGNHPYPFHADAYAVGRDHAERNRYSTTQSTGADWTHWYHEGRADQHDGVTHKPEPAAHSAPPTKRLHPYPMHKQAFETGKAHGKQGKYSTSQSTGPDWSYWYHEGRASTDPNAVQ